MRKWQLFLPPFPYSLRGPAQRFSWSGICLHLFQYTAHHLRLRNLVLSFFPFLRDSAMWWNSPHRVPAVNPMLHKDVRAGVWPHRALWARQRKVQCYFHVHVLGISHPMGGPFLGDQSNQFLSVIFKKCFLNNQCAPSRFHGIEIKAGSRSKVPGSCCVLSVRIQQVQKPQSTICKYSIIMLYTWYQ